jgi:hypothetical protein
MKLCIVLAIGLFVAHSAQAQRIERSVLSCGAVRASSGSVSMQGTIGQPIIGRASIAQHRAGHGFWHTVADATSSVERSEPFHVRLSPQPAVTVATIETTCVEPSVAQLMTLHGQQVADVPLVPRGAVQQAQFDCSTLASGMYLVRLRCGSQQVFLPLVIAK